MKKLNVVKYLIAAVMFLVIGTFSVSAATTIPNSVKSDGIRTVEYIDNFPVIVKTTDNGSYYVYCLNMEATYAGGVTFTKTDKVNDGYVYLLTHKPNTGDKDKDFYISQMAVWYYEDFVNNNNYNLEPVVKNYILSHKDTEEVSREIYKLYEGAKNYHQDKGTLSIDKTPVTFTVVDGYYVSSEIIVINKGVNKLKYSLENAPAGTKVVKSENGVKVKVPVEKVTPGKQINIKLNIDGSYIKYSGYYYFHSAAYQKVLFQDPLEAEEVVKDSLPMTVSNIKHPVNISKTDITQANEVPGAKLVIKDEKGNVVDEFTSTTEKHVTNLYSGNYSLTETIAPKGYRLSTTTIYFTVDGNGVVYVKNENGTLVKVDRVIMINELLNVVRFAKKDSKTGSLVAGAKMIIKDHNGNVVKEFTTTDAMFQMELDPGEYTLAEVEAPKGYVYSHEIVSFMLCEDGTLKVKNTNGEYVDSAVITFLNTKETSKEVKVPATGNSSTLLIIGGLALLIGGIVCVKKTIKEC